MGMALPAANLHVQPPGQWECARKSWVLVTGARLPDLHSSPQTKPSMMRPASLTKSRKAPKGEST